MTDYGYNDKIKNTNERKLLMITDKGENLECYAGLGIPAELIWEFIQRAETEDLAEGKYELLGNDLFAMIQVYETKAKKQGKYEAHKAYIDIQYMLHGQERMYVANVERLRLIEDRTPVEDVMLFEQTEEDMDILVRVGCFALFYPQDAHLPCCMEQTGKQVKKIVFKWKV